MGKPLGPVLSRLVSGIVLLVGLALAMAFLPAARAGRLPPRQRFVERFEELARRHGVELAGGRPRVHLVTESGASHVREVLGEDADRWLAAAGRGLRIDVASDARWDGAEGLLELSFSARGEPWNAEWT